MTGEELRKAVFELLDTHPSIAKTAAHEHAHLYRTSSGRVIGIEPERIRFQNLWVAKDDVDASRLAGINKKAYQAADYGRSRPNHNLFGNGGFDDVDLICFKVTGIWQAVRVILEVAGDGGAS
ncbi:hypothetical protein [Tabrizicola flagellatus]|uniref:hypothetical protein n=1 Tax=Tabrizicola flagellatus TaxID=2593021 RepID=UPI0011F2600A|nr:hypothetical protein [Tabrizicola flagellatus]